jgi:hypothetical protein
MPSRKPPVGGSPVGSYERPRGHGVALSTGDLPATTRRRSPVGDPKNVKKLAADAAARAAASKQPKKKPPVVAKQMRLRGKAKADPPLPKKPKGKPNAVLKLITDAIDRRGKS